MYLFKIKTERQISMHNVISNKSNMREYYFCQCFSLLVVNYLKLNFLLLLQTKKPDAPA